MNLEKRSFWSTPEQTSASSPNFGSSDNKHKTISRDVRKSKGEAWSDGGERLERCVDVVYPSCLPRRVLFASPTYRYIYGYLPSSFLQFSLTKTLIVQYRFLPLTTAPLEKRSCMLIVPLFGNLNNTNSRNNDFWNLTVSE
jgi:hypothetical protein